ncbi:MAG: HTTM domain-containing protein [Haliangiales bacterium]
MLFGVIRFWRRGWIDSLYLDPSYHFAYWGFEWVQIWPPTWLYVHFAALAVLCVCVALGLFYRVSITLFFLGFTYVELIDKTTYLNHYYLISVLSLLMIFLPLHRMWSIDAWLRPRLRSQWAPRWCLWAVRYQVGLVYFFAGVAKLKGDWLWRAEPMATWLALRTDTPLIGPLLDDAWVAYAASWFGALFDLTIVGWLCWRRTRYLGFALVVFFHLMTAYWFYLGMFPWIMMGNALIFFSPSWPRRWLGGAAELPPVVPQTGYRWYQTLGFWLLGCHLAIQTLLPLRYHLYSGDVCWTEQGFRYAWHVMLMEKTGRVVFYVTDPATERRWTVYPKEYLTANQELQMSTQPDMILAMAHHIAADFAARGTPDVEVRAEAYVSLNGRPSALLIDPSVDLAAERDQLSAQPWILPLVEPD